MKKLNASWLPYAAAAVNSGLFGAAGYHYFKIGAWGAVIGVGVGAVVSMSVTIASSRINDIAEKRKGLARLAMLGMLCLSPATVVLSLFYPGSIFTAIAWAMDADVAVILTGAISGKSLIAQEPAQSVAPAKKVRKSAKKSEEVQEKSAEPAALVAQSVAPASKYPHECGVNGCTYVIKNAQSVGGHMKAKHPASLGIFEPIKEQVKQ